VIDESMKCTLEVAKEIKFFQRKWTKILYYNQSKGRRKVQCGIHINFTVESTINPKIFFGNPFRDSFHRFLYELVLRLEQMTIAKMNRTQNDTK